MDIPSLGAAVPRRGNRVSKALGQTMLHLIGWKIVGEVPNRAKLVVIGAPHTSNWDFPVAMAAMFALGIRINWLGKASLFRGPMRTTMRWLGGLPIDRDASQGFVEHATETFRAKSQLWLGLAPEGTRQTVTRWRTGFYHIAQDACVPILPFTLDFGRKQLALLPLFIPSGDAAADIAKLQAQYVGVIGKRAQPMGARV